MRLCEALCNLGGDFDDFADGEDTGEKQLAQGIALNEFHCNVVGGTVLAEFIDGDDIGVIKGGCGTRFALEALQAIRIGGECGGERFDRESATEPGIACSVDFAHAAGAQQRFDLIGAELAAWKERHNWTQLYSRKTIARYICD